MVEEILYPPCRLLYRSVWNFLPETRHSMEKLVHQTLKMRLKCHVVALPQPRLSFSRLLKRSMMEKISEKEYMLVTNTSKRQSTRKYICDGGGCWNVQLEVTERFSLVSLIIIIINLHLELLLTCCSAVLSCNWLVKQKDIWSFRIGSGFQDLHEDNNK